MEKMKRTNLLVRGFRLALRNWPCVVWAYAVNLIFGLLAGVPFTAGLASYLDHSLAAQRIAGTIDIASLGELGIHLGDSGFFPIVVHTAGWLNLLQLLLLFVLFAGSVFVFVSGEPPRISVLLRGGAAYFFRFVRAAILAGCGGAVVLAILLSLRAALLAQADEIYVGSWMFYCRLLTGAVVLLAGLLIRLWWDLVEVYIVRNAMRGERSVRRALLPALRLLYQYFFRAFGSFLVSGAAGVCALGLCLYVWKELVPPRQVWMAFLLAQAGLFLLLASRFWQRGLETTLVMSVDPPIVANEEIATTAEEEGPAPAKVEVLAGASDPTLRELVLKLQNEPWANPQVMPLPMPSAPPKLEAEEKEASLVDQHATKFPLGGPSQGEESEKKAQGNREPAGPPQNNNELPRS
jgi:hypothetical protein